jgi:hypothetical protein
VEEAFEKNFDMGSRTRRRQLLKYSKKEILKRKELK